MNQKFQEYKGLDLPSINKAVREKWERDNTFHKSIASREGKESFVFYEGPPSANGMPGIHHVISRTIKDIFCRYKTLKGYQVQRKAGWDTHGLPVELGVEKLLGITKEDIGEKISVEDYNDTCRREVMKYTDAWEELTDKMGYWTDMENPYITYDNRYIETVWHLLKKLFEKDLLYKGYSIQPYSPAAGTGLSTHELNQPGCYRDVKDTTVVAQFKAIRDELSEFLFEEEGLETYFLAWTTTPWTLPSNTALAVGKDIVYKKVKTFNQYTGKPQVVILAKDRMPVYFLEANKDLPFEGYKPGDKKIPYQELEEITGEQIEGIRYEQLIEWVKPGQEAFRVLTGDFVTTEEGTGIVHIAPTFGEDDYRVAKQHGIPALVVRDVHGITNPLVDKQGRFYPIEDLDEDFTRKHVNEQEYLDFAGRFVKNEYDESLSDEDPTIDVDIAVYLKKDNKAFKIEKHVHNYPHCWRTDKPVLYYPLDSWFVRTTAMKGRLMELNKTINWKPESTGTGRFGKWLENLVDWNLSRSRYWGTPLPIWVTKEKDEEKCIGSVAELRDEMEKAVKAGVMDENPLAEFKADDFSDGNYNLFDLHRPFVDNTVLVSSKGKPMYRETDLIDVWFDSGAMPYAQLHYPFENMENFSKRFPADFIAEGVDQTRGWFFTLHALAGMLFDSVAYKNIMSNGLILDKKGNKMSKRLGNAIDPFQAIEENGADPVRWYLMTNSQPWDNIKFDMNGVDEIKRKFFGTLYNTYSFFALYANVDGFYCQEKEIALEDRPEIDRWIISLLNSLCRDVDKAYQEYEVTRAARAIQLFVTEHLSNWYVRLNRKRFWGGEYGQDKIAAYQTLYQCLETIAILISPVVPFYADQLFQDLNGVSGRFEEESVHLVNFPGYDESAINNDLEEQMDIAQQVSSMILGLRRKVNIKVRQPLQKIMLPLMNEHFKNNFEAVKNLILTEVNVKEVEYITDTADILVKKIKPNFKVLGPKHGKKMKQIAASLAKFSQPEIQEFERQGHYEIDVDGEKIDLGMGDVEILSEDIPGWLVANEGNITIALDVNVTDELRQEGIARELVNRIQNIRKESGFEVTDKIKIEIEKNDPVNLAIEKHKHYIQEQTLARDIKLVDKTEQDAAKTVEIDNEINTLIYIEKTV